MATQVEDEGDDEMDFGDWTPVRGSRGSGRERSIKEERLLETQSSKRSLEENSSDENNAVCKRTVGQETKLIIKFRKEDEGIHLSPLALSRELKKTFGELTLAKTLRDGNLLITVRNEEQKNKQREEKQLEASVDSLISLVALTKNALQSFIYKLENEYERLTWPNVLDNFGLLSGQLNTINKMLKNEKTPSFRSQVIIPLVLSQKSDDDLTVLTEQRVPVFSHEIVPDYLRTKPDPEVEEQEKQLSTEAARIGPDVAQKQIQALNKMCSNLLEKLNNPRDDRDAESAASRLNKPSFNPGDTNALVAAVAFGKGLSKCRPPGPMAPGHPGQGPMMSGGPTLQQVTIGGGGGQQAGMGGPVAPQQQGQPGKMPSSIKTNIKSASASMHPYNR